jgi:cell division septum initiation protein DivIVA
MLKRQPLPLGDERLSLVHRYISEGTTARDLDERLAKPPTLDVGPDRSPRPHDLDAHGADSAAADQPLNRPEQEDGDPLPTEDAGPVEVPDTGVLLSDQAAITAGVFSPASAVPVPDLLAPQAERASHASIGTPALEGESSSWSRESTHAIMLGIDTDDLKQQAERLRSIELPRGFRGYDEQQTRRLLDHVANAFEAAAEERVKLQHELESLRAATKESIEGKQAIGNVLLRANRASEEIVASANEEATAMVVAAEAEAQRILERARREAEELDRKGAEVWTRHEQEAAAASEDLERERVRLRRDVEAQQASVESEREAIMNGARAEAERVMTSTYEQVERLERTAERLRAIVSKDLAGFVEISRTALDELARFDVEAGGSAEGNLLQSSS